MVKKKFLSLNAMDKLIREAGGPRVSEDAKVALAMVLEEQALRIAKEAAKFAEHAGRKTVTAKDIQLVTK
jgi:DNA-binding protein